MKFQLSDMQKTVFGALEISQTDDGFRFRRCTWKQIEVLTKIDPFLGANARAYTGIRFDFHTDAEGFSFLASQPGHFDILIDSKLTASIRASQWQSLGGRIFVQLPEGEHRVTVTLPFHSSGDLVIRDVTLIAGTFVEPHVYDSKLLFLGDSITQGWESGFDSLGYAFRLAMMQNADFVNMGVGGSFFLPEIFPEEPMPEPDTVIVAYGTNDWDRSEDEDHLRQRAGDYLDLLCRRFPNAKKVGITPLWRAEWNGRRTMGGFDACRRVVREQLAEHGFLVVDGYDLVPNQPEFFTDGLHPNATGFECYAENLHHLLSKNLEKKKFV